MSLNKDEQQQATEAIKAFKNLILNSDKFCFNKNGAKNDCYKAFHKELLNLSEWFCYLARGDYVIPAYSNDPAAIEITKKLKNKVDKIEMQLNERGGKKKN